MGWGDATKGARFWEVSRSSRVAGVWPATGSRPSQNKAIPKRMSYSEEDVPDRRPCFVFTIRETISVTANHKSLGLLIVYS